MRVDLDIADRTLYTGRRPHAIWLVSAGER